MCEPFVGADITDQAGLQRFGHVGASVAQCSNQLCSHLSDETAFFLHLLSPLFVLLSHSLTSSAPRSTLPLHHPLPLIRSLLAPHPPLLDPFLCPHPLSVLNR